MFHVFTDWLGMNRSSAVVGLHLSPSHLSLAVVRPGPTRLTAIGRQPMAEAAMVNDEVRLTVTLATDLAAMAKELRLPEGIGVVAAIEPLDHSFQLIDGDDTASCPVRQSAHDRLVGAVHGAGLKLLRVDPVPAALARLARQVRPDGSALRGAYRWSVVTGDGRTDAERSENFDDPRLRVGVDQGSMVPLEQPPTRLARPMRSVVDLDRDGVAIGAALAGFGLLPLVDVHPSPEGRGGDWAVQRVAG